MKNPYARFSAGSLKFQVAAIVLFLLTAGCENSEPLKASLPRSTPEAEGVSSNAILDFLEAVENSGQELHSFMFLRHGKVIAEGWWDPYKPELKHTLYSTSKSFTSTAIGFAVSENLITVDDKVVSFFPEFLPDSVSTNLADMAIRDLLTMSAGQDPEPTFSRLLPSDNWMKAFLSAPVVYDPGTTFLYNSSATYMLSAIITKVTGQTALEYLTPRLFEPLKIEGMDWEVDPMGINVGGWGLRLKTEDMAKFGQLFLQMGKWNGVEVVPEKWIEEATTKKIEQAPALSEEEKSGSDWLQGYCYKFWRSRHNSYRADGAYGQYILILPEEDAVIAITAEVQDMQKELSLVWDYLLPAFSDTNLATDNIGLEKLHSKLHTLALAPPGKGEITEMESGNIEGSYLFKDQDGSTNETVNFSFENGTCIATFKKEGGEKYLFRFGSESWVLGETSRPGTNLLPQPDENMAAILPFKVAGACRWKDENILELTLRYVESPHSEYFTFEFDGDNVTMQKMESRRNGPTSEPVPGIKID